MSCPNIGVLEQDLTFSAQFINAAGTPTDLDALPTYKIYEEVTNTEILSGTMAKQDDANTEGYYIEKINTTTANGFESLKTYTIRIEGVAGGIEVATVFSFICLGQSDLTVASGDALTTTARFKTFAGITSSDDDTLIGQLITRATNAIQRFTGRDLVQTTYREFYNGEGQRELKLKQFPVISVSMLGVGHRDAFGIQNTSTDAYNAVVTISDSTMTLQVQGGTNAGTETLTLANYSTMTDLFTAISALSKGWSVTQDANVVLWSPTELLPTGKGLQCLTDVAYPQIPDDPAYEYYTDYSAGILGYCGRFCYGFQNIVVRYVAGYASIPADLEQICIDLVKSYYDGRKNNSTLKREKIGDYEYENGLVDAAQGIMPGNIRARLKQWVAW